MNFYTRSSKSDVDKTKDLAPDHSNHQFLRAMKIFIVLMTVVCLQVSASAFSQRINISQKNTPLVKILKEIKRQTGYFFLYDTDLIQQKSKPVTINLKNAELADVLTQALKAQPFGWEIKENTILIFPTNNSEPLKAIDVTGKIVDESGNPMPGASVRIKGQAASYATDNSGNFAVRNVDENAILVISYIGYADREVVAKAQLGTLKLTPSAGTLSDVVVTGYTNYTKTQSAASSSLVTSEKINTVPGLTVDQILQGRVPGMSVISTSGQPGQSAAVVIRGIGSVNGSSTPLFVLDGVPIEAGYFQTINPEDIESATVLKDASAKALYGSRGSNGVIVLTTKKGKAGKLAVNYTSQYGFSNLSRPNFTMMNTEQRLQFEEEIGGTFGRNIGPGWTYSSKNPTYAAGTATTRARADFIIDSLKKINTDWRDIFFQRGKFQEQQVSISGGNENLRFYNSLNYYSQEGVAKRTGLDRYSLRSNLDFKDDKFSGSVNLSLGYSESSFTEGEGGTGAGTAMASVYYALPYENPYASDGTLVHPGNRSQYFILDQREGSQALERLLNSSDKTDQLKSIISTAFAYQILPELKLTTRAGIDYRQSTDQQFVNPDSYYGSRSVANTLGGKGRLTDASRRNFNIISTTGLTYAKKFNGLHDFEASAFYEYVYNNYNSFGFSAYGIDGRLPETPAGATNGSATFLPSITGGKTKNALASIMGVARYTYDNKYTLTGSYRYDGSTRVATENKWHGFYSIGANWNVKSEEFLKNNELINDLRVRGSYGITASPFGGDFLYLPTYAVNSSYGGAPALRATTPGNDAFDWEYVKEFNTGFDLAIFKNRLRITADYYNRKTTNMFINQPLSATSGFSELNLSAGVMQNRGVEFEVSGDVIKNQEFLWTIGVNAGYNKNKILHVTDLVDSYPDGDSRILKVGLPYGTYFAPDWAGVNPQTGEPQYYNLDGSITTAYNVNTQSNTNSGSLYPTFTGGFNTSLSYKGITASALFSFVSNVMRWNNEDFYNENQRYATSNQSVRMLENRWQVPGDSGNDAILQKFDLPRNFTSKDIQDASFLRLRNLNIGYSLPKSILEKTKIIKGVKIFVQGQNLFTWTKWRGLDPENNAVYGRFQYPNTRTYTAGLNVNF
ncbi:TonB-dependent receptor [Pedobacter ginsengiterrae]|uniref:TonB-dependent receptor n=1 Tax=Pedobacter ginsengiterrae TaxID=871696 RepID=A0ABP7PT71_9SPHI